MSRLPKPIDKLSAQKLLSKFMENAMDAKLKHDFSHAVDIIYGRSFEVRFDLSHRMTFFCCVCNKEMNSVKSIEDHKASGTHIKNVDTKQHEMRSMMMKVESRGHYRPDTLHSKLDNATVAVVGLQHIEGYFDGRHTYFKCNLCCSHGKADAMYKHAIGNSHTDKYIKMKVVLTNPVLDAQARQFYREEVYHRDRYTVDDIIVIKGRDYYPYQWEQEMRRSKARQNTKRKEMDYSLIDPPKMEDENEKPEEKVLAVKEKEDKVENFMSYDFFNQILLKFNVMKVTHEEACTDVLTIGDLKMILLVMDYVLHLLHYTARGSVLALSSSKLTEEQNRKLEAYKAQKDIIKSCLGYVRQRLDPRMKRILDKITPSL